MDQGKIIQIGTPKEVLYKPQNDFVKNFFKENRLLLEYKTTFYSDLKSLVIFNCDTKFQFSDHTDVWTILQKLSSDNSLNEEYEKLVKAFNEYRKLQVL